MGMLRLLFLIVTVRKHVTLPLGMVPTPMCLAHVPTGHMLAPPGCSCLASRMAFASPVLGLSGITLHTR